MGEYACVLGHRDKKSISGIRILEPPDYEYFDTCSYVVACSTYYTIVSFTYNQSKKLYNLKIFACTVYELQCRSANKIVGDRLLHTAFGIVNLLVMRTYFLLPLNKR